MAALAFSPQEERIRGHYRPEEKRTRQILETFAGTHPSIDIERGKYFTESFRETSPFGGI